MNYDKEQIRGFHKNTLWEYNNSLEVEKIAKVNIVNKTDSSFIQIGIRPLIKEDMFIFKNWHPALPSVGRTIAKGERDFLIKSIFGNKKIEKLKLSKREFLEFPKFAYGFNQATILISLDYFIEISQKLMQRIQYKEGRTILDYNYDLIFIPGELMKRKIIIIDKESIIWEKQEFFNEHTNQNEKIDIKIIPRGDKADITMRSVNKIKHLAPEGIKILEVEE